jgi:hypothetical protein
MQDLYKTDYYSWAMAQADALKRRAESEIDWDNVCEELECLSRREERELGARYRVLNALLLKWIMRPVSRTTGLKLKIENERDLLAQHFLRNRGLHQVEAEEFSDAYQFARHDVSTGLDVDLSEVPESPPFTMDQAKDDAWWPA